MIQAVNSVRSTENRPHIKYDNNKSDGLYAGSEKTTVPANIDTFEQTAISDKKDSAEIVSKVFKGALFLGSLYAIARHSGTILQTSKRFINKLLHSNDYKIPQNIMTSRKNYINFQQEKKLGDIIGWARPDGTINFESEEKAMGFGKCLIMKALNRNTPYEIGISGYKNTIYDLAKGKDKTVLCNYNNRQKIPSGGWDMHGHPALLLNGKKTTGPFSPQDWMSLMLTKNIKKSIVYNSNGEKCIMEKVDSSFLKMGYIEKSINKFFGLNTSEYNISHFKAKSMRKKADKIVDNQVIEKWFDSDFGITLSNEEFFYLQKTMNEYLHKFWTQNQKKYGIKYISNFASFKDMPF